MTEPKLTIADSYHHDRGAMPDDTIPKSAADIVPEWLTSVLRASGALPKGRVVSVHAEYIGEGVGFASSLVRLGVRYAEGSTTAPDSFVAKLPNVNPKTRAWTQLFNRFEREILFYQQLSKECVMPTARCYYAGMQSAPGESNRGATRQRAARLPQWLKSLVLPIALWSSRLRQRPFILLLEDLSAARPGNQLDGSGIDDAAIAATELAKLHAQFWGQPDLERLGWMQHRLGTPAALCAAYDSNAAGFYRGLTHEPPAHIKPLLLRAHRHMDAIHSQLAEPPFTLLHGDYRLDNIFFRDDRVVAVDWDLVSQGRGILDWAYFVMGNLCADVDDASELRLLKIYHDTLLEHGVSGYNFSACSHEYLLAKLLTAFSMIARPIGIGEEDAAFKNLTQCWSRRIFRRLPENQFDDIFA